MSKAKSSNYIKANQVKAAEGGHRIEPPDVKVNVKYPFLNYSQPIALGQLVALVEGKKGGAQ